HAAGLAHPLPTRQPGIDSQTAGLAPGCGAVGMEEDPVDARCAIGAFALFAVAFGGPRHAAAEGAGGVGVVTTLRGEATVARVTLTQPLALRTHDDVLLRDRITTQERSLVHVLLGTRALLTVR